MKRQERHHLKENELAQSLLAVRGYLEPRKGHLKLVAGLVVIALAVVVIVMLVRDRSSSKSEEMLGEALVTLNARVVPSADPDSADLPAAASLNNTGSFASESAKLRAAVPKLKAAADAYPDSTAGITARYHLAGALAALGQSAEAAKEFASVATRAGDDSFYGRMARLGEADSLVRAGQLDAAIAAWKQLAEKKDDNLPADAILISLARAYALKGNTDEARKTFTELVDGHPDSPYSSEARTELANLKG